MGFVSIMTSKTFSSMQKMPALARQMMADRTKVLHMTMENERRVSREVEIQADWFVVSSLMFVVLAVGLLVGVYFACCGLENYGVVCPLPASSETLVGQLRSLYQ